MEYATLGDIDQLEAVELSLPESDLAYLEEPYEPKPITGHY